MTASPADALRRRDPPQPVWVLAHDLGPAGDDALGASGQLVSRLGGRLIIAHARALRGYDGPTSQFDGERDQQTCEVQLDAVEERARRTHPGLDVRSTLLRGSPVDSVLGLAETVDAEGIIIGTHGYSGIRRLLAGSIAEALLRRSDRPVLIIRVPPDSPAERRTDAVQALDGAALWRCPTCGRSFSYAHQSHGWCARPLEQHLAPMNPALLEAFEQLRAALPLARIDSLQAEIVFVRNRTFAALHPRDKYFWVSLALERPLDDPRVQRVEVLSGKDVWSSLRVHGVADLDAGLVAWLQEAAARAPRTGAVP